MTESNTIPSSEEKKVSMATMTLVKDLIPFIRPYAWMLALTTLLVSLVTGFELLLPMLTQKAIDGFIVPVGNIPAGYLPGGNYPGISLLGIDITSFTQFCMIFGGVILGGVALDFSQTLFRE